MELDGFDLSMDSLLQLWDKIDAIIADEDVITVLADITINDAAVLRLYISNKDWYTPILIKH